LSVTCSSTGSTGKAADRHDAGARDDKDRRRPLTLTPKSKALEIARLAAGKQGANLKLLNIGKLSSIADYIVICGADSERQVKAIAAGVEEGLLKKKEKPINVEGLEGGRWVLMDYNDVIVHIFLESTREFYDLDGLWADAPGVAAPKRRAAAGKGGGSKKAG